MIENFNDLMWMFGAKAPGPFNDKVYEQTGGRVSVRVLTRKCRILRCGEDWAGIMPEGVVAFQFYAIVEGSEAELSTDEFRFPVDGMVVRGALRDLEAKADEAWRFASTEAFSNSKMKNRRTRMKRGLKKMDFGNIKKIGMLLEVDGKTYLLTGPPGPGIKLVVSEPQTSDEEVAGDVLMKLALFMMSEMAGANKEGV